MNNLSASPPVEAQKQSRAWYAAAIAEFLLEGESSIIGKLTTASSFTLLSSERIAWTEEIRLLKVALEGLSGSIYLEFSIPRMGRRIDTVIVIGPVLFAIEFKVGETVFERQAIEQVWDYALDLKNFHEGSHNLPIVPIVIATEAKSSGSQKLYRDHDQVFRPLSVAPPQLRPLLEEILSVIPSGSIDAASWSRSSYRPTPTIIEAARSLYANHSVDSIARYDAGAKNLRQTSARLDEVIDQARINCRKAVCFVTGVPGAGKTLVGLNVATHHRRDLEAPIPAVFLSGNGPLVAVLREALARDEVVRAKTAGEPVRKGEAREKIKAFIQNVHHFRDDALVESGPPPENVVIFDEAQRAWNAAQTASFMRRKKNQPGFDQSEAHFLISFMDRHRDWAVIICLVGGGQEINTGEAGISSWLEAVQCYFPHWELHISSRLTDHEYAAAAALENLRSDPRARLDDRLHLAVSMRSFRSENVSHFVKALLDRDATEAKREFSVLIRNFPVRITRNLDQAKSWVRSRARGSERFGLVASSKAQRLKPHAVDIRVAIDPVHWFLSERDDTRSSFYLEDAATEFQVQGLELDWTCVTWDADLRVANSGWSYHDFRGSKWCNIKKSDSRGFLRNAYRVLLTRARQGMVIFVPPGDAADPTRLPEFYDSTFRYLRELGIPSIEDEGADESDERLTH